MLKDKNVLINDILGVKISLVISCEVLNMKRETLFLKIALFLIAVPAIVISIMWLPWTAGIAENIGSELAFLQYLSYLFILVAVTPYLFSIYQTFLILGFIDRNLAFSDQSVKALKKIKYSAMFLGIQFMVALPFLFYIAEVDDAPGIAAIGLIIILASIVISVFAAVLEKLLKHAMDIKSENDLTI